jgi:hypothetical protein
MSPNHRLDGVESRLAFEFSVYPIKLWNLQLIPIASYSENADANYVNFGNGRIYIICRAKDERAKNPKKGNNVN